MDKSQRRLLHQFFSCLLFAFLLSGCIENRSTAHLCINHPQICEGLNINDGQCNQIRTQLLWLRFDQIDNPSEFKLFDELELTKTYAQCMEVAGQTQSTTLKSKQRLRTESLIAAYQAIENIEAKLEASYLPSIIYYRWTKGDPDALDDFLKLENTDLLNTPELQLGLATYYHSKDKTYTLQILKKGLSFYDGRNNETLKKTVPELIKHLATTAHANNQLDEAYLWSLIGKNFAVPIVDEKRLALLYPMDNSKRVKIQAIADEISEDISDGKFDEKDINALAGL
ncbi:MAG: DUF2989 domain-containing protein [Flavobacteriales bacterium]|nr:DUF2989 domain-containing protein [Flavobacteriales bacterium]